MTASKPGRNDPCHCGSGSKYKRCCLEKDQAASREAAAKAAEATEAAKATDDAPSVGAGGKTVATQGTVAPPRRQRTEQPWKGRQAHARRLPRFSAPRKVGS